MIQDVDDDGSGTIEFPESRGDLRRAEEPGRRFTASVALMLGVDVIGVNCGFMRFPMLDIWRFMTMMSQKILNRDPKDEILKAFRLFDDDETGKISFKNLKRVAKELGENMTDEELQEMIDEADRDGDGEVNEEEFFRIMKKTSLF